MSMDSAPGSSQQPPRRALAVIFMIVFMDLLGFGIIIPQLPFYATAYEATALQVTVLFSVYSACQFLAAPLLGSLSDRYGRRPVLVLSQLGSALGYVLLGLVPLIAWPSNGIALAMIYLSRVIDGASGGNISTAQAYISDVTTPANRAKGMGLIGAAFGIGFSAGPALAALVGGPGRQHWPAFVAAGACFVAMVLTYLFLPESRPRAQAAQMAMASVEDRDLNAPVRDDTDRALLADAAQVGRSSRWLDRFGLSAVIHRPVLLQLLLISFASMAAFVMMESSIALYLSRPDTYGFDDRHVGWFFAMVGVVILVVQGGLIGRLTRWAGEWPLAILGPILVAVGMAGFVRTAWGPVLWLLALSGAINATGRSLQQPTLSSLISRFSDPREQGVVFGLYHGLSSLARVAGPVVAGLVYEHFATAPFVVSGLMSIAVGLWTLAIRLSMSEATTAAPVERAT